METGALLKVIWPTAGALLIYATLALVGGGGWAGTVAAPAASRSVTIPATLDRIEGSVAVLYWGANASHKVDIPASYLPRPCPPGTSLEVRISVDTEATRRRQERVRRLRESLRR